MLEQITIAESMNGMLSSEHCSEQSDIVATQGIESSATAAVESCGFAQLIEFMVSLSWVIDHREGLEISLVRDQTHFGKAREVCDALGHRKPSHDLLSFAFTLATDLELIGMIDHCFDAQYETVFVVHFDPVGFHPVFDPCASRPFLTIVEHLSLEVGVKSSPEKRQYILGAEAHGGVFQQFRKKSFQGIAIFEHNVRGKFVLVDYPVVLGPFKQVTHKGIDPASERIELAVESLAGQIFCEALGSIHVFDPRKCVIYFLVGYAVTVHFPGQPFVAVDADLYVHGKPRLDTHVHHAPFPVNEIVVKTQTFALSSYEARSPLAVGKHEALAWLYNPEDTYQPACDPVLAGNLFCHIIFAIPVGVKIQIWPIGTSSDGLRMVTQAFGLLCDELLELFDEKTLVHHEGFHRLPVPYREISLEDYAVRARQDATDLCSMLFNEFFQRPGLICDLDTAYHDSPGRDSYLVAAKPR